MRLPGKEVWGEPEDPATAHAVLRRAIELGINFPGKLGYFLDHTRRELLRIYDDESVVFGGGLEVTTAAYGEATRIVRELARRHAEGRLVSALEGGYDLDGLAASVVEHLRFLSD